MRLARRWRRSGLRAASVSPFPTYPISKLLLLVRKKTGYRTMGRWTDEDRLQTWSQATRWRVQSEIKFVENNAFTKNLVTPQLYKTVLPLRLLCLSPAATKRTYRRMVEITTKFPNQTLYLCCHLWAHMRGITRDLE